MQGGKPEFRCGYPGTASLFPYEASWSGTQQEKGRGDVAHGVIIIEGAERCVEGTKTGWLSGLWCRVE